MVLLEYHFTGTSSLKGEQLLRVPAGHGIRNRSSRTLDFTSFTFRIISESFIGAKSGAIVDECMYLCDRIEVPLLRLCKVSPKHFYHALRTVSNVVR